MKKTFVLLSVLEKRARQLKKGKSLKWHQALDEAAIEHGFSNFKNYKNTSESEIKQYKSSLVFLFKNISLENDIFIKMKLAISFMQSHETPFRDLLDILKQFQYSEEAIQAICDKLQLMKDEIQSFLLNDLLTEEGQIEINFRAPYFIAKEISINNLTYEINKDMLYVDGHYILRTKFDFENIQLLIEGDRKDDRLNDRLFTGSFGITIDRDKKITMEHSDMSADDELTPMHGFTEKEVADYYNRFPDEDGRFDDMLVLDDFGYDDIKRCISNNEPLTGKALELALDLVNVHGADEHSRFVKNIGVKMKAGQPLDEYEHHIMVDVLMLHAQLGS